jgi:N-acetylneuraminic acid mutarotase
MNTTGSRGTVLLIIVVASPLPVCAQIPVGTAFTYQGQLEDAYGPVDDSTDMDFTLWDAPSGGTQIGGTEQITLTGQDFDNGLFSVSLDFGALAFTGEARWLEIAVRSPSGSGTFTTLTPRQAATPTPYALYALNGAGGSFLWQPDGSDIFYDDGSVGIGTAGPLVQFGDDLALLSATLPSPRYGLACAADSATGRIYCFGGVHGSNLDEILEFDPVTKSVRAMSATLPAGRWGLAAASSATTGRVYCFGGYSDGGVILDEIVEYDPATDSLTVMFATLPTGRWGLAAAACPTTGKIYCFGGYSESHSTLDDIVEYDPATGSVTVMNATLPTERLDHAAVGSFATGKIYCFGGRSLNSGLIFNEIVQYDPATDNATVMTAVLPWYQYDLAAAACPRTGRIYCFGGERGSGDRIVEYDASTDSATVMDATLPMANVDLAAAGSAVTGKVYCLGGRCSGGQELDEILEYTTPSSIRLQVGDPGDGTGALANGWEVFSSREFKRDIKPLDRAGYREVLAKLNGTDVVRYRYAEDIRRTVHLGVVAEKAPREILSPGGKSVSLAEYSAFLMAAIKAQQAEIAEFRSRLERLEATSGAPIDSRD